MERHFTLHKKTAPDLEFALFNVKFNVAFEDGFFSENEREDICDMIDNVTRMIQIDKTYVETKKSNFKGTFLIEDGWNSFCTAIMESEFCAKLDEKSYDVIIEAFTAMAQCYAYECLSLYYPEKIKHIAIEVDPKSEFDVVICSDVAHEWSRYPGKWQTWKSIGSKEVDQCEKKKSRKPKRKK